ncbi:hypothetical protein [Glycomyces tenuis]|uniref:hypothetical protein n=1 Tax=Glycomyces tenuis TaxID=58116 RepID=UPI000401ECCA|nr:hypothetical protein [Glycomyces tenuis]
MASDEEAPGEDLDAGAEQELPLEVAAGPEAVAPDLVGVARPRPVVIAAVVAGVTAAAVIGAKIAYDRRRSAKGYKQVVHQLEDARDALIAATAEMPERGRAALRRMARR